MDPQLFARVPPEVWDMIFQHVEGDPFSFYNCCNVLAPGAWNDVLSERITTFLFPLVLPILREELSTKEILTLRRVCKTWKSAADNLLEEMSPYYPVPSKTVYRHAHGPETEWFGKNKLGTAFNCPLQIEKFMGQMKMFRGNPFVNNTVKILANYRDRNSDNNKMLYQKFTNLIENFGHHILTCVYIADGSTVCNKEMQYLFEHLPNLRCLAIKLPYDRMSEKKESEDAELRRSWDWLRDPDSLPSLPHLKSLNLFSDSELLCHSLLKRYGRQLHSLSRCFDAYRAESAFKGLQSRGLEFLRALKIDVYVCDFGLLERISDFHMPHLERLHLTCSESDLSTLKTVVRVINKFSSSLVELRWPFNLFSVFTDDDSLVYEDADLKHEVPIRLPHVKWMGIPYSYFEVYSIFFDNFIYKFPNLEHLHLMDFDKNYISRSSEREFLFRLTDDLLEMVPSLKNLTVEEKRTNQLVFRSTRLQYKYRKQKAVDRAAPFPIITDSSDNDEDDSDGSFDDDDG